MLPGLMISSRDESTELLTGISWKAGGTSQMAREGSILSLIMTSATSQGNGAIMMLSPMHRGTEIKPRQPRHQWHWQANPDRHYPKMRQTQPNPSTTGIHRMLHQIHLYNNRGQLFSRRHQMPVIKPAIRI